MQYEQLFSRQQEIQVDITLQRGGAEIIAEAAAPTAPSSPGPVRNGVLGAVVGLLLGLGLAFAKEHLNTKLRSREEAERLTGLATLAELPFDPETADHAEVVAALAHADGALAEAERSLRVSIGFCALDAPCAVWSSPAPSPQDGKSFVAANLASVYAAAGYRTILVQADLRRPAATEPLLGSTDPSRSLGVTGVLTALAELEGGNGRNPLHPPAPLMPTSASRSSTSTSTSTTIPRALSQVTVGGDERRRVVEYELLPTVVANLRMLPAGMKPPNPAELLGSPLIDELLRQLGSLADMVVIDTPPVMVVADPVILAKKADGVVLVASVGQTARDGLQRAKESLDAAHARILGVVINRSEKSRSYYSGYYGDSADEGRSWWQGLRGRFRRTEGAQQDEPAA